MSRDEKSPYRWSTEDAGRAFKKLANLRIHPPGGIFDQLEFHDEVEAVLNLLRSSTRPREMLLEGWLLMDYMTTYLLRDGLQIPSVVEVDLNLLPFQFERKLDLISRLYKAQLPLYPNPRNYAAMELSPDFRSFLEKNGTIYKELLELAMRYESEVTPREALALSPYDYETVRFVPDWWIERVGKLDRDWFTACRLLNKARNVAAHRFRMADAEIFGIFRVKSVDDFRNVLCDTISRLLFRPET